MQISATENIENTEDFGDASVTSVVSVAIYLVYCGFHMPAEFSHRRTQRVSAAPS
jgi:hypothetical protein